MLRRRRLPAEASRWPARSRLAGLAAAVAALFLIGASSAWAQERVYNPGFEFDCSFGLMNWTATGGASPACDPIAHTGAQSLALTGSGASQTLRSDCITGAGSGSYAGSFWYRNQNSLVTHVAMSLTFYSATDCSGIAISNSSAIETFSALNDPSWHQLSGSVLAYPGSKSARVELYQGCTNACAAQTVRYDDLSLTSGNRVYNPGFEFDCSFGLMNWTATGGASPACDPIAHTGAQSLALTGSGASQTLRSDCITGAGSGSYAGSFWYRNQNSLVTHVAMSLTFYSATDCSGIPISNSSAIETFSALNDPSWHQLSGSVLAYPGSKSARVELYQGCTNACPQAARTPPTVRYDDVTFDAPQAPTAVGVIAFQARRVARGVRLTWLNEGDASVLGFRVLRSSSVGGRYARLARALIPCRATHGTPYAFVDRRHAGGWYRLEVVRLDGTTLRLAPVSLR